METAKTLKNVKKDDAKAVDTQPSKLVELTPERKEALIELMEKAAKRPREWLVLTLNNDIQELYRRGNVIHSELIPTYEPVDKLEPEMCAAVTEIFRSTDEELKEMCQLIVICSLRGFLLKSIASYTSRPDERDSFIQACLEEIVKELPKYDYNRGAVTMSTFFGGRLTKILGEQRRTHDQRQSTRYYFTLMKKINGAIAGLREMNEDPELNPTPDQISAWLQMNGEKVSAVSVIHCMNQSKEYSALDDTVASQISTVAAKNNPEELTIANETITTVMTWLKKQSPLVKCIMSYQLGRTMDDEHGKQPTQTELISHVKKQFPGLKDTNILRQKTAAFCQLRAVLSPHDESRTRISTHQITYNGFDPTKGVLRETVDQTVSAVMEASLDEIFG